MPKKVTMDVPEVAAPEMPVAKEPKEPKEPKAKKSKSEEVVKKKRKVEADTEGKEKKPKKVKKPKESEVPDEESETPKEAEVKEVHKEVEPKDPQMEPEEAIEPQMETEEPQMEAMETEEAIEVPMKGKKTKSKATTKDKDAPKQERTTGWLLFCIQARLTLPKPDVEPSNMMPEMNKMFASRWNQLTAEQKAVWSQCAAELKEQLAAGGEKKQLKQEFAAKAHAQVPVPVN